MENNKDSNIEDLNKSITAFIEISNSIKELETSIKSTREKIKEENVKLHNYKSLIEEYLINNNIDTYTFNNYKFGIVERKKTKKPDKDEIHDIIYNEIKDKMTKNTDVIKTTDNILNDIINGSEVEKVKKVNIKKLKNNQPKIIKFNKKRKSN